MMAQIRFGASLITGRGEQAMIGPKAFERRSGLIALACIILLRLSVISQDVARIEGVVRDQLGAPVQGATVALRGKSCEARTRTDENGRFQLQDLRINALECKLVVDARGFALYEEALRELLSREQPWQIKLAPASFNERVTVTASRIPARLGDTPQSLLTLSRSELETTAAPTLDDALRQIAGFSLFRRASSRTANPTAQGVSLRGVGASGASRALVLADGVPLNDPFGGWVYWGRVPSAAIERIEVLRGAASDLYGSSALGGVIQILTRRADKPAITLETSYGNERTGLASLFAGGRWSKWGIALAAEGFRTDGYILVDGRARGPVDTPAGSERFAFDLTLDRSFDERGRIFWRGSYFGEVRGNGTPLQTNQTRIRQLSGGINRRSSRSGEFDLRAYLNAQVYDQTFSAVAPDRRSEDLTRAQRSPSQSSGAILQWSKAFARHTLIAGSEVREVRGASDETAYAINQATSLVGTGGRQRTMSFFAEEIARLSSQIIVTAVARYDRWRNFDALRTTKQLARNVVTVEPFVERGEAAVSPRLSALYRPSDRFAFFASAYRAFRAPTLNELYRSFRVGDVLTLANPDLRAERLVGGEAGASYTRARFVARSALFWSEIARPVANVTISVAPNLITRQRQNLGRTRARGLELDVEWRAGTHWAITGGYLLADATVISFPVNRALEGLRVPQVARHQFTIQTRYGTPSGFTFAAQARASSAQFDDDQNLFRLAPYFTMDLYAARKLRRKVEVFGAVENVFDARYDVGRTPIRTVGPPRLVRLGLRLTLSAR